MSFTDIELKQRGRAEIDFLGAYGFSGISIRQEVEAKTQKAVKKVGELSDDLNDRNQQLEEQLDKYRAFRIQNLMGEWYARHHGDIAIRAFEELQPKLQNELDRLTQGASTLSYEDDFEPPSYWDGVEFHRTQGGWDGHPHMGFVHGEIIHRKMVDKFFPGGIFKQRKEVAELATGDHFDKILDMGCSSGHFTVALAETYPNAEITGVDLSLRMLEHSQRVANDNGWSWRLLQRAAEDTGFANDEFDLVTSYILLHEIPDTAIRATFAEAFRVLKPGGEMLMSDVTRYADMNKLDVWRADRGAIYGGEPHWRSSASLDLKEVAESAGFVDVSAGGVDGKPYPYVVQGRKPHE